MSKESDREIWKKLAADTKPKSPSAEELPKAEDYIEGPLPEDQETAEERARKLEVAKRAEESRKAEELKRKESLHQEEEQARKTEEARKAAEKAKKAAEEARIDAEARKAAEVVKKPVETVASIPVSENLLLLGLINLLQPALEIKLESKKYQRWIKGWDKIIEMHILGEGHTHVIIKDNTIKAALGKAPREPDIVLEGEYEVITNYLNGELDPILMFFDFVLLRKIKLVKGLEFKLSNLLGGGILKQASDLYKLDKILKIR
ncbi:MAG TPA: hypothetical protein VMV49_00675 [Candidatus Deferrimicrobium sp.]|nr:hypothetical protein [Candidatus Deferrimicrobium sp.]